MEQKKKGMPITPDVKKKRIQKTHDVTKKEDVNKLSDGAIESVTGGGHYEYGLSTCWYVNNDGTRRVVWYDPDE